jgi:hypothetical protein
MLRATNALVATPGICTVLASAIILTSQSSGQIALSQVATAVACAAIGPAVSGITLGIFKQGGFVHQNGLNQAYNHAGNAFGAALSGLPGWKFGLPAVFALAMLFAIASTVSVMMIPGVLSTTRQREAVPPRPRRTHLTCRSATAPTRHRTAEWNSSTPQLQTAAVTSRVPGVISPGQRRDAPAIRNGSCRRAARQFRRRGRIVVAQITMVAMSVWPCAWRSAAATGWSCWSHSSPCQCEAWSPPISSQAGASSPFKSWTASAPACKVSPSPAS